MRLLFSIVNYYDTAGTSRVISQIRSALPRAWIGVCSNFNSPDALPGSDHHIRRPDNPGYGTGHNSNIREALRVGGGFDAAFFLNTDITLDIYDPAALQEDANRYSVTSSLLFCNRPNGRPHVGYFLPFFTVYHHVPYSLVYPAGSFFGVSAPLITPTLFDEDFFLYFEEVDLRLRHRDAKLARLRGVTVNHSNSRVFDPHNRAAQRWAPRSRVMLAKKHYGEGAALVARLQNLLVSAAKKASIGR